MRGMFKSQALIDLGWETQPTFPRFVLERPTGPARITRTRWVPAQQYKPRFNAAQSYCVWLPSSGVPDDPPCVSSAPTDADLARGAFLLETRYAASAGFFRLLATFDRGFAAAFFFAAQYAFILSACCLR